MNTLYHITLQTKLIKFSLFFSDLIDRVFREDDYDNNGYLSYEEYKMSRREPKMSSLKKSRKKINDLSPV